MGALDSDRADTSNISLYLIPSTFDVTSAITEVAICRYL